MKANVIISASPTPTGEGLARDEIRRISMGTDCNIYLPASAKISDIAELIGILVGMKKKQETLTGGGWYVSVDGVRVRVCESVPEMVIINLEKNEFNAQMAYCHFEAGRRHGKSMSGYKLVSSSSRPIWCAIGKRLVAFFGGFVVYSGSKDRATPEQSAHKDNDAGTNKEWQAFQRRMWDVTPLTKAEVNTMKKHAAYDE